MVGRVTPNSLAICCTVCARRPSAPSSSYMSWAILACRRRELGFLAACASAGAGGVEAVAGAFGHQRVFELSDRAEDLKEHPADGGRRVDALVENHEVDAPRLQLR